MIYKQEGNISGKAERKGAETKREGRQNRLRRGRATGENRVSMGRELGENWDKREGN